MTGCRGRSLKQRETETENECGTKEKYRRWEEKSTARSEQRGERKEILKR